ncbi:hypothetical protein [Thiorhodospira sibirica]|uniref:hypothetical protein n=1 Tax=Thiorhodospira sibirica TaxID=154347 RepID=UPI00022C5888|nr:hypothetical protein [Thiorhodospira sibirica]
MFTWLTRILQKFGFKRIQKPALPPEQPAPTPQTSLPAAKPTPPTPTETATTTPPADTPAAASPHAEPTAEQKTATQALTAEAIIPPAAQTEPTAAEIVTEIIIPPPPKRPLNNVLKDIEYYASWSGPDGKQKLQEVLAECASDHPGHDNIIAARIQRGEQARQLIDPFYKIGNTHGKDSTQAKQALAQLRKKRPDIVWRANKQLEKGNHAKNRYQEARSRQQQGQTISRVKPRTQTPATPQTPTPAPKRQHFAAIPQTTLHPQDIRGLKPSPHWTLLIDETGTRFDPDAQNMRADNPKLGRIVGLLMPQRHGLNQLPRGWHAVDQNIAEIDRVIQAILDAPVGVLGITVQQLPQALVERWAFAVLRLIDLVLRLLPIDGPTQLTVEIEQRNEFAQGMEWKALAYDALLRLAQTYPQRARQIQCQIRIIGKRDSSFNGYVDALAFIWSASAPHSRECLKNTQFIGNCFLTGDAQTITRTWEWLDRGIALEGDDWAILLTQQQNDQPGSLITTILERLGQTCQTQAPLWERYLEHTLNHLDSKAIDLRALGQQVQWLEHFAPAQQKLPPLARYIWLIAKLAHSNHLGQVEQTWRTELHTYGQKLMEENAPLVCRAELNLAVNLTNRYEFTQARETIQPWSTLPIAIPGLRYFAQIHSTLGQHAAFTGDTTQALAHFDQALNLFAKLSNPHQAHLEMRQTQTYRAIALMDAPHTDPQHLANAITTVTGPLPDAASTLATSNNDRDKYTHHLLVRYLALHPNASGKTQYLQQRDHWAQGQGHPWPLIQLYRAILLHPHDPAAALEHALEGVNLAQQSDQGPVVQLIGACIRVIAHHLGNPWPPEHAHTTQNQLTQQIPAAQTHINKLTHYIQNPDTLKNPKPMLEDIIPFNFH